MRKKETKSNKERKRRMAFYLRKAKEKFSLAYFSFVESVAFENGYINEEFCKQCPKLDQIRETSESLAIITESECGYSNALLRSLVGFFDSLITDYQRVDTLKPDPRIITILKETEKKCTDLMNLIEWR